MSVRDISVGEAKKISPKVTDLIEDFISKRGRIPLYLVLEANKVGFEFPPRAPPVDAKKSSGKGIVGICPKTNVGVIETETHYQLNKLRGM